MLRLWTDYTVPGGRRRVRASGADCRPMQDLLQGDHDARVGAGPHGFTRRYVTLGAGAQRSTGAAWHRVQVLGSPRKLSAGAFLVCAQEERNLREQVCAAVRLRAATSAAS